RINFRANINSKIKKWLTVDNNLNGSYDKFKGPVDGASTVSNFMWSFQRNAPTIPLYYSNGAYGYVDGAYESVNFSYPAGDQPLEMGVFGDFKSDDYNINNRFSL